MLERIVAGSGHAVARLAALVGGYLLLAFSFVVGFEVIARKFFGFSLQGVDEIGGYVLAVTTSFALSYALLRCAHTRVDLLLCRMPPMVRAILNTLAAAATTAFAAFMAWRAIATLEESIALSSTASTPLQTPLWIPQTLWVIGLCTFAVTAAGLALAAVTHLVRGDIQRVNSFCGTPSDPARAVASAEGSPAAEERA